MTEAERLEDLLREQEAMVDTTAYQLKRAREAEATAVAQPEPTAAHPDLDFSMYDFSGLDLSLVPNDLVAALMGVALQMNYLAPRVAEYLAGPTT